MNDHSPSVPQGLEETPTCTKVEHKPSLTGLEASPAKASTEQPNSVERVRFDRRKRRPAAIITSPGYYVPNYIESGDPLKSEHRLRNTSPPERVLVGHGRPRPPKLYFENSAPLLGSKEDFENEEAPDLRAEPPHSAPPSGSDSWSKIPNVQLTPRCLRLASSDLAERLGREYPDTPRSASFNQPSPRFKDVPDSPTPGASGGRRTRATDDSPLRPETSATDGTTGNVATPTRRSLATNVTDEASSPKAAQPNSSLPPSMMPELDVMANATEVVGSREELGKGAMLKHTDNRLPVLGFYNTYRVDLYNMTVGGGTMAIIGDSNGPNHEQNGGDTTEPAGDHKPQQITPNAPATSERASKDTPDLALRVPSSKPAATSTIATCPPTGLAENGAALPGNIGDNTGPRVYGSMMDNNDLGVGSVNHGLDVGAISSRLPPHTQQLDQRQLLPQRPQGICQPTVSQAQQHHPQGNISVASRGLYLPSVNQAQGYELPAAAQVMAYEHIRANELRSLPTIHHNPFGIATNQVCSFKPNVPDLLPLGPPPFIPSTNGRFGMLNDTVFLVHPLQPNHLTVSSSYPPQVQHHRPQVREGRYRHGRHPGATNLTAGGPSASRAQESVTTTGSVNLSDDTSLSDSMAWQEDYHPCSLNVLNLPRSSVPNAANFLSGLNPPSYTLESGYCCFIIKSKSEEDVRASIIHGIWSSTEKGNQRLNEQYNHPERDGPFLLVFCVNGSREVCGMAEMISPVDFESMPDIWQEKGVYKGSFKVRWVFCKNADYALFSHILLDATRGDLPALHLRDALPFKPQTAKQVIRALARAPVVETILTHPKAARPPRRPRGQNPAPSGAGGVRLEAPSSIQIKGLKQ